MKEIGTITIKHYGFNKNTNGTQLLSYETVTFRQGINFEIFL
jgi:hypothetical protein